MNRSKIIWVCLSLSVPMPAIGSTATTNPSIDEAFNFGYVDSGIPPTLPVNSTPPRTVELLSQALDADPAEPRRVELVRDLGLCELPSAAPAILAAMSDPDASVRAEAATAAALNGDSSAVRSGLQKLLSDSDPAVRREALVAGDSMHDETFVAAGLQDPDESVFAAACARATTSQHYSLIARRFPSESRLGKLAAIRALGSRITGAYAPLVASQLNSDDLSLVIAAVKSLENMDATSQRDNIVPLLNHQHPTIRRVAVEALSRLADSDQQIAVAKTILADPDFSVRQAAAELLIAHPSGDAVPYLLKQLTENYPPLRDSARDALVAAALLPVPAVIESAATMLTNADPDRREDGSYILGHARSDVALQQQITLLNDANWMVVGQAAESLGRIGRPEAGPALAQLADTVREFDETWMSNRRLTAVESAFISLGQLHYKPALPLLKWVMPQKTAYPAELRTRVIWASGLIGDADDRELAAICLSISNDNSPFESEDARFEAIKAIGNLHYLPALDEMRRQATESPFPTLRWMAHLVADRLDGGRPTTYTPPTTTVVAETSIMVLQPPDENRR
jgi:HEAT repeat protein